LWSALSCVFIVGKNVVSFEHRVVNTWSVCNESIGMVVRMRPAASGQATVATVPPTLGSTDLWARLSINEGSTQILTCLAQLQPWTPAARIFGLLEQTSDLPSSALLKVTHRCYVMEQCLPIGDDWVSNIDHQR